MPILQRTRTLILAALLLLPTSLVAGASSAQPEAPDRAQTEPDAQDRVVLLHGFARSKSAVWLLAARLENAGFIVERIGYSSFRQTPEEILEVVSADILACCTGHPGQLHFVGHSFGGLLSRAFLEEHPQDNLGRVVLIGTPNQGTPFVDRFRDSWWFRTLGPTAAALGTDGYATTIDPPDYPVGVIAGRSRMSNEHVLPGGGDGLVSVESTRLEGMHDFVEIKTSHAAMRWDKTVADQTIHFLKEGEFERAAPLSSASN